MSDQNLLRPAEAAAKLAVSRSTIYTLIHEGEIPFVRVRKSIRIPADQLRAIINGKIRFNRVGTPDTPLAA